MPGHAIPRNLNRLDQDEGWFLKPFQAGEGPLFIEHIRAGVLEAAQNERALLVFSGGASDERTELTEARGYWQLAEDFGWFGWEKVAERVAAEGYSRDSFENLLFSVCRFRQVTGVYPHSVSVVGWAFKEKRFVWHRETLRYPAEQFRYQGVNNPQQLEKAVQAEQKIFELFQTDPYGCGDELSAKRESRNPHGRAIPYAQTCPELAGLLGYRGPELFAGSLPWLAPLSADEA